MPRRTVNLVEVGEGITFAALVCEDLAQIDEVADLLRSVGPTMMITPLLDGPQLSSRWSARYASVLADDPGSAVLTLTSNGMARRSRPRGRDMQPIVALWKDPIRGTREIPLEPGAQGVLLTASADLTTRRSGDGRRPIDNCTSSSMSACIRFARQPRAPALRRRPRRRPRRPSKSRRSRCSPPGRKRSRKPWRMRPPACTPCWPVRGLARPGARRSTACNRQPSSPRGLDFMCAAIEQRIGSGNATLAGVLESVRFSGSDLLPLDQLARSILGAALEQRLTRQAWERRREAR